MAVTAEEWTTNPFVRFSPRGTSPVGSPKGRGSERGRALSVFQALEERKKKTAGDKERLEDQASENGEGFFSAVVASFVEAVDRFEPLGRFGEQISDSCNVVG